jgi:hypothetical protein
MTASTQGRKWRFWFFLSMALCLAAPVLAAPRPAHDSSLLMALRSPIILKGDAHTAYRDPLLFHHGKTFYLFYSYVIEGANHLIYWTVAESTSRDLEHWSAPRVLTPKDQDLNYSSPGSLTRFGGEWILSTQTYPIANFHRGDPIRWGDARSRVFLMRSRDLEHWSAPELIRVKGPNVPEKDMGQMIDSFLLQDKDVPGKWWCFYKQKGHITASTSRDLKTWTPTGEIIAEGENPEVIVHNNEYLLFYAPVNGIGVKESPDLIHWKDYEPLITLGQKDWPWAELRLTAGYVADLRAVPGVGKYVMVCHSMGPGKKHTDANVQANCNIVIAWSDDLKTWHWPGESAQ